MIPTHTVPDRLPIRTKVDRWSHPVARALHQGLEALRLGQNDTAAFQARALALLLEARLGEALAAEIALVRRTGADLWLVRRHVGPCRYTLQLVHVAEDEVHPLHQHHNLISTQIVLEGRIRLREYDRVRKPDGSVVLSLARDAVLYPGEPFQASEWARNVHGFEATGGPAILWNFNARGYERTTFAEDDGRGFGRRVVEGA